MYYLYTEYGLSSPHLSWHTALYTSTDGLRFTLVSSDLLAPGSTGEYDEWGQADPTVVYDGPGDWKMWFDALDANNHWRGLGYATSSDGVNWTKHGQVLSWGDPGTWDSAIIHHPCVVEDGGTYYMFFAGSNGKTPLYIGGASSPDGINWTKFPNNPLITTGDRSAGAFDADDCRPSTPILVNGVWLMTYWGRNTAALQSKLGVAVSPDLLHWQKAGVLWEPTGDLQHSTSPSYVGPQASRVLFEDGLYKWWFLGKDNSQTYWVDLLEMTPEALAPFCSLPSQP
jgi:predicted GH43/DUF377 family glycosyl hydrolase